MKIFKHVGLAMLLCASASTAFTQLTIEVQDYVTMPDGEDHNLPR